MRNHILKVVVPVLLTATALFGAGSVAVTPGSNETTALGGTRQYNAAVTGLSSTAVNWSVSGPGSIDPMMGLYSAPPVGSIAVPATVTVTATAVADPTAKASVTLTLLNPGASLTSASPNTFAAGNFTLTLTGNGFQQGAQALILTSSGFTPFTTTYKSATQLGVSGAIYTNGNTYITVKNPNSMNSNFLSLTVNYAAPNTLTVSPSPAVVPVGMTQAFTALNNSSPTSASWSVTGGGTITSAGVYTAPAVLPNPPSATITATTNGLTASATVNLVSSTPPQITNVSPNPLPLGVATISVSGTGFVPGSTVSIGGIRLNATLVNGALQVTGYSGAGPTASIIVNNGPIASAAYSVNVGVPNPQVSASAARRFLEHAAFGPTPSDAAHVQQVGFTGWINEQFALPVSSNYGGLNSQSNFGPRFLNNAVNQPDQLRQRVAFALSQIFVVSMVKNIWTTITAPFEDMLMADAFVNFRQILEDVTLKPAMGQYLDMANNGRGNTSGTVLANENYAREVLQLFSIGTTMLNQDGTQQIVNGQPVPTYNQATIGEFAKVFTGWTYAPTTPGAPVVWGSYINNTTSPMMPYQPMHDITQKTLLAASLPPAKTVLAAGQYATQDLKDGLDNIFYHPNVGPFISKQLIQHLVKSNPSPAYVGRVAAVFNDNGQGVRGDMKAVVTQILTDIEARANDAGGADQPTDGHMQEPAVFLAGLTRAFGGTITDAAYFGQDLATMGEDVFSAPSVFNYFSPGYRVPQGWFNTPGVSLGGPEFQIYTAATSVYRANLVNGLFSAYNNPVQTYGPGFTVDLTPYVGLVGNPSTLVAALDLALTHGTMPSALKQIVTTAVQQETGGAVRQVQTAVYLIISSNYYNVWH